VTRDQKITFREMRRSGHRSVLVYCSDYKCGHWTRITADAWDDDVRLSDIEPLFTCTACGNHGADVRPDFDHEGREWRADRDQDDRRTAPVRISMGDRAIPSKVPI